MRDPDQCPICGDEVRNLNNHVRMKNDEEHGPVQQYPEGYDPDSLRYDPPDERPDHGGGEGQNRGDEGGGTIDAIDIEEQPDDEGDDLLDDPVPLQIGDRPGDMREYDCPNCEETVEYLDNECSNGHGQQWVMSP